MLKLWLLNHCIGCGLIAVALLLTLVPGPRRLGRRWLAACLASCALGGFLLSQREVDLGFAELDAGIALGVLFGIGLIVASFGLFALRLWSKRFAIALLLLGCLSLGAAYERDGSQGLLAFGRNLRTIQFVQPWWLLLWAVVPVVVLIARRSLTGLGPVRQWSAIVARALGVIALVAALAEPRLNRFTDGLTVLFVVDRSYSIPQDIDPNAKATEQVDRRWLKIQSLIDQAVRQRGAAKLDAQSGVVLFGKRPRLAMPPARVTTLPVEDRMAGPIDGQHTDIASALKLAMASFPESTGKRIVLISDGNETLGNAEEQAAIAKQNGVQIDTIALAPGYRNESEVLVQAVEAPGITATGNRLPVRVLIRNANPNRAVEGLLELIRIGIAEDGTELTQPVAIDAEQPSVVEARPGKPALVRLMPGLSALRFRDQPAKPGEPSYSYRATFSPIGSRQIGPDGALTDAVAGLAGDRIANNRAATAVVSRGQRRVVLIEDPGPAGGSPHEHLIRTLLAAQFDLKAVPISRVPINPADFALFLSSFDCILIANVPAESFTLEQMEAIRNAVRDQGCGLVMVGGPDSYGPGGYQNTPIEAALPVDCEIKSIQAAGRGGLILIMHASEMADGNKWQKDIAKLAIQRLNPQDMVGVMQYGFGGNGVSWVVPFQEIADKKSSLLGKVDGMTPGDMPDFDPFLQTAVDTLITPEYALAVKHTMIISDGDPSYGAKGTAAVAQMAANGVTCTTVGVATHSAAESGKMKSIALGTRDGRGQPGSYYEPKDPNQLPAIYIKESRRISQSFVYDKRFAPQLRLRGGLTEGFPDPLPALRGFVRTTLKDSPLAQMTIEGPAISEEMRFPVVANWIFGLGKAVAYTSDARTQPGAAISGWDKEWVESDLYKKFWEQTVNYAMRSAEKGKLTIITEQRDGRVRVLVDARDERDRPVNGLSLGGRITLPNAPAAGEKVPELNFKRRGSGQYEAEFPAEDAGTYFVTVQASEAGAGKNNLKPYDSARAGVTVPYSPEFADLESNTPLMKRLSTATDGNYYSDDPDTLVSVARSGELFRDPLKNSEALLPFWYWLVFAAGLLLLVDVGVRRVAIDAEELRISGARLWTRLRATPQTATTDTTLEQLRRRKEQVGERIEQDRAARRFEGLTTPTTPAPTGADALPSSAVPPRVPPTSPPVAPPKPGAIEGDFFSRMQKAKRRADFKKDDPPAE